MMIRVAADHNTGFAISPNDRDLDELVPLIENLGTRVAIIDMAPTTEVVQFVNLLVNGGLQIAGYFDHHLDKNDPSQAQAVMALELLVPTECLHLTNRQRNPACTSFLKGDDWNALSVQIVVFHDDADGFLSFLKGLGLIYPGLDADAEIFDGAGMGRRMTKFGELLILAANWVPMYGHNPQGYFEARQELYQTIVDCLGKKATEQDFANFAAKISKATEEARARAQEAALTTTRLYGRIGLCNCLPLLRQGLQVDFGELKRQILQNYGNVLICTVGLGHLGEQVYIELPPAWRNLNLDLRLCLPEGVNGRLTNRVQVPLTRWEEFRLKWHSTYRRLAAHLI